jgi:hypothetical protein
MKVADAIQEMSKQYLHRIIDSFTKDFPKPDEDRAREIISRNVDELTDPERVLSVLRFDGNFSDQILFAYVLEALVNRPEYSASEQDLVDEVTALEQEIIDGASDPEALRYEDSRAVEIFKAVLEVALEDMRVSAQELSLVRRLREKLGLSEQSKRLILAQLQHFPTSSNRLHGPTEFKDALIDLQRRGVVFYCNRLNNGVFVVPEEIVPSVRQALGIELSRKALEKLLEALTKDQMASVLDSRKLPKSGRREELQERIIKAGLKPSQALDVLSNQELYKLCSGLPGAKVSGTKPERIGRVIDYFANLVVRDVSAEAPPGERFYKYLVELAHRDRENLLANKVIRKDRDMDGAFEEGTRHLFSVVLGLELTTAPGSDHCDGCMRFGKHGELFMWDNKSKETVYSFPTSHMKQFKRYIRDAPDRVSCFLVIVPEIAEGADHNAARLKVESGTDTDIALITAEDLLWLAEEWRQARPNQKFNLDVLNITGILSRPVLEQRLKLFT